MSTKLKIADCCESILYPELGSRNSGLLGAGAVKINHREPEQKPVIREILSRSQEPVKKGTGSPTLIIS